MRRSSAPVLLIIGLLAAAGCTTAPVATPAPPPLAVLYNGENRLVTPAPLESLKPGDEVLLRDSAGGLTVAIVSSQRAPGVYRLRHLDLKLLSADNYAGRLLNVAALTNAALAARTDAQPSASPENAARSPAAPATVLAPVPIHPTAPTVPKQVAAQPPAPMAPGFYEDLRKLEDLRSKGVLTEAEFQAAKQRVLGR